MSNLPSCTVVYVKHPEHGWLATITDDMPASLAAHLIIDTRDPTPDEIARGQKLAALFDEKRLDEQATSGLTLNEIREKYMPNRQSDPDIAVPLSADARDP